MTIPPEGFAPIYPVRSNSTILLERDNPFQWTYSPGKSLPDGSVASLTFSNLYGQALSTWVSDISAGVFPFYQDASFANAIPAQTSWQLTIDLADGKDPRLFEQGTVARVEAQFPNAPATNPAVQSLQFSYPFGTPGVLTDPAWVIFAGTPTVYDNSGRTLPNAVAGGGSFVDVVMRYYAPLNTDATRATYTTVPSGEGNAVVAFCGDYNLGYEVGFTHTHSVSGGDTITITTVINGTSTVRASVSHNVTNESFTALYDPTSNTFSIYVGTDTVPLLSWVDSSHAVDHGVGFRYWALGFHSTTTAPGVEIADVVIADAVGLS